MLVPQDIPNIDNLQMEHDQLCQLLYSHGYADNLIDLISTVILSDTTFGLGSLLFDTLVTNGSSQPQFNERNSNELPF